MRRKKKQTVTPVPGLEPHPVERLMLYAEQLRDLSNKVLATADDVRQELSKNVQGTSTER